MSIRSLNLQQVTNLIASVGPLRTVVVRGQPGVGKSSILSILEERFPDYQRAYVDCANLDLGDIAMPVVDRESMTTSYAPNSIFGVSQGSTRPVLMMLDEISKAGAAVLNMLLPVLLERRLGSLPLPAGSIVFATGNLDSDKVGDKFPAHAMNRVVNVDMRNPTADEWLAWAAEANVHPAVQQFARTTPEAFERYDTEESSDERRGYIFDPSRGMTRVFCSPRSLHAASDVLHALGDNAPLDVVGPVLDGTVGQAAARKIESLILLGQTLPSLQQILNNPTDIRLPGDSGAAFLAAVQYVGQVQPDDLDLLAQYLERWEGKYNEALSLAVQRAYSSKRLQANATKSRPLVRLYATLFNKMV